MELGHWEDPDSGWYWRIGRVFGWIAAVPAFFIAWAFAISEAGFLTGVCVGWIAGFIVGLVAFAVAYFAWAPILILAVGAAIYITSTST